MIIFFTVDLMVIVFMLFGAVGLAYEIMSVLVSDMVGYRYFCDSNRCYCYLHKKTENSVRL